MIQNNNEKVSPYDAWCIYTAISLHFKEDSGYNAIKYNFKGPKCSQQKFESSRTKFLFEKLASKYPAKNDLILYCVANEVSGANWINDYTDKNYQNWLAKIQKLDYTFSEDIKTLEEESDILSFNECIIPEVKTETPLIYKLYKKGKISIESLAILENMIQYVRDIDKKLEDPLGVNAAISNKILKYSPFIVPHMQIKNFTDTILSSFTF